MKIEPCPFCGSEVITDTFERISCPNCCYRGGVLLDSNEQHNRLSRIVRAAEDWAVADAGYRTDGGCMEWADRLSDARRELRRAVEGGRADG